MFSYRYMQMEMNGMRHGTRTLASSEVYNVGSGYLVSPEKMSMRMHMIGAMYAPSDVLTVMLMTHYIDNKMDHRINPVAGMLINANEGAETFRTQSQGMGDVHASLLYQFRKNHRMTSHLSLGLSLPTGSIDKMDAIPVMGRGRVHSVLPAPMQLGSGTVDLLPSLTLRREFSSGSLGIQARGTLRLEDANDRDYRLGHQFGLTGWACIPLKEWISLEGGVHYQWAGQLKGDQKEINQGPVMMGRNTVTTAYGENYGGEAIEALLGVNLLAPRAS